MNIEKSKTTSAAIALILTLSLAISFIAIPVVKAYDPPWTIPTSAYVTCAPSTIGLGQSTTIVVFVDRYPPTAGGAVGQRWDGFKIDITKPDGTKETIGPWKCGSAVASDFKVYTPDQIGTYTIVFSWPGGKVESSPAQYTHAGIGDIFLGSTSQPTTLVVTADKVPIYPETPLPTDYWTRPLNAMNRDWTKIASNWLGGTWLKNNYQRYGTGPTTAHILWTAPILADSPSSMGYPGGLVDGSWPGISTNINDYQSPWRNPIIMNGILYYSAPTTAQTAKYGYYAVDLHTGERLWYKNGTDNGINNPFSMTTPSIVSTAPSYAQQYYILSFGQLYYYYSVNGQGVASFLWMTQQAATTFVTSTTTWYMLDSSTGNVILTLKNVPSGTAATGQDGSLLIYRYIPSTGNFLCWNSSQAIYPGGPTSSGGQVFRPPLGAVIDAVNDDKWVNASTTWGTALSPQLKEALKTPHSGYTMNVTSDSFKNLPGSMTIIQDKNRVTKKIFGSSITTTYGSIGGSCTGDTIAIWCATVKEGAAPYSPWPTLDAAVNTNLGFAVTLDYYKNITVPIPGKNHTWSIGGNDYESDTFMLRCAQTGQLWAYKLSTGELKWGPTPALSGQEQFEYYGQSSNIYDDKVLVGSQYTGTLKAYDVATGKLLWTYEADAAPYRFESAYGRNMPLTISAVCDGMVYVHSTEHSPTNPLWRQSYVRCINMTDGTLIWKLPIFNMALAIADGKLVAASQYDNLIYTVGKGPSAVTVSAPQSGVTMGSSFVITGTVTDQSPGAKAVAKKMGYTNGVACVSDASQEGWMSYLYMQQPCPADVTGVPVRIDVLDPNGNYVNLGTATNNLNGVYGLAVDTNDLDAGPGLYEVIATFEGSGSYGSSFATTYFTLDAAPETSPPPEYPQPVDPTWTIVGVGIAMIIAVALAAVWIKKK
ncbi:MAG: PQQ-binding-like beta-propeller repeat protein [Candidatus Bathyarchaeota archaeon]|nr:PQQ-binding-like beta-propeller repeat protein [Candidatus Bathyarchaeota archaeon]